MIMFEMVKKICKEHETCLKCPFNDDMQSFCMINDVCPSDWDINGIEKAFDDTHIIDEFYNKLSHKLLEIMPNKHIDKDKLAAIYEEDANEI